MNIDDELSIQHIRVKRLSERTPLFDTDNEQSYIEQVSYQSTDNRLGRQMALQAIADYAGDFEKLVELTLSRSGFWNDNQRSEIRFSSEEDQKETTLEGYVRTSAYYAFPGAGTFFLKEEVYQELLRQVLLLNGKRTLADHLEKALS